MSAQVPMTKKRTAVGEVGGGCPLSKKATKDALASSAAAPIGSVSGVSGWQYPPLPMGMMPPMPFCMPGNPFFPFMGMFPPFWLPAAAMAAATMPALAAASAASAANANTAPFSGIPGAGALQPPTAMWPMMACSTIPQMAATSSAPVAIANNGRTSSGVSGGVAIPSTSCTNSVPTMGAQSPSSPPPMATSPASVCNGPLGPAHLPAEDAEFANFIDSFLKADDGFITDADLKALQPCALLSSDGSSGGSGADDPCFAGSESHSLLTLLGDDLGL